MKKPRIVCLKCGHTMRNPEVIVHEFVTPCPRCGYEYAKYA